MLLGVRDGESRVVTDLREVATSSPAVANMLADGFRSIVADYRACGDLIWQRFTGGQSGTLWYYRALVEVYQQVAEGKVHLSDPVTLHEADKVPGSGILTYHFSDGATLPLRDAREVFEREYLLAQVTRFGGNISRTAAFVGMERSALHRKLKSLGVFGNDRPVKVGA